MSSDRVIERETRGSTLIYRFGGMGNDWCFVRIPDSYDPQGCKSPFIICNHGNGWVMDGSEQKANFSGRTQYGVDSQHDGTYLNENDPEYREYSNPTIEAFLKAGYVVCGAQNFGDSLYGNELCLQACVDFYHHIHQNYNVDQHNAFMLGCSNGFLTSLNTATRLGRNAFKAMIGLYPLCNLKHAFDITHTRGVKLAYGIDSEYEYATKAGNYDPFQTNEYPPMMLVWSLGDQVLPMQEHALKFAPYLRAAGNTVRSVRIDSDGENCPHGHWRHFLPQEFVAWCELYRT